MGLFIENKRRGRKIINHHIVEGTREAHPRVHDSQHPRLGKPRRGLQIMDTRMGFPCPFHSVVIDSISEFDRNAGKTLSKVGEYCNIADHRSSVSRH